MKKILLTSVIAVMATFTANASVAPYVSLHGGYDNAKLIFGANDIDRIGQEDAANSAYDVSGAFGVKYDVTPSFGIRGEIEYDFADAHHVGSGDLSTDWIRAQTILFNGYIDFKNSIGLNPYFSAGIGYQWLHHPGAYDYDSQVFKNLAYQFGTGITYSITKHASVDLGYRYLTMKKVDVVRHLNVSPEFHQFRLGATYTF
ncbi:MAG: porin family protein [Alphaproteobacteria bacterium]|nr:porin family protein [Alphaproteobacteria bacterium]